MKALMGNKIIAEKINDCVGLRSFIGLRFKKSFGKYDAYLIHMLKDSILTSMFVRVEFLAIWLDNKGKILHIEKCKKNNLFPIIKNQKMVLELPINSKVKLKKGDIIKFKA